MGTINEICFSVKNTESKNKEVLLMEPDYLDNLPEYHLNIRNIQKIIPVEEIDTDFHFCYKKDIETYFEKNNVVLDKKCDEMTELLKYCD